MAVYKVPQDVEADDKLIGPFSFRQFIYLIIVAMAGVIAWGLAQLFIPLAIIPVPIMLFFGAIALPLRKDQPMEIYMAAMFSFLLKPHLRKWDPDGIESLIEITVPKTAEFQLTKDISQSEAQQRFNYLAEVVDSQGWAVRGASMQAPNSAMNSDVYFDAQKTEDILDDDNRMAQILNQKLSQSDIDRKQGLTDMMKAKTASFNYFADSQPTDMQQQPVIQAPTPTEVVTPIPAPKPEPTTSEKPLSAGIINLANSTDLSIATIASQANRINEKQNENKEVFISLR